MNRCLIALGANIDASSDLFRAALNRLASMPNVLVERCSQAIRTSPVGANAGDEFLNAAATIRTDLSPLDLLSRLHIVENEFGRERTIHWGPRRLDLDLILYALDAVGDEQLVVPHPACWYRKFVLQPAAEIAGDMIHPLLGESIDQLFRRLCERPIRIAIETVSTAISVRALIDVLRQEINPAELEWSDGGCPEDTRFAVVRVDAASNRNTKGTQPTNQSGRQIAIWPSDIAEAVAELSLLAKAILGE